MSTIRGVKDRRFKFVQLLNSMFEDPKISLKAKGFIGFCLTKKENWDFHISHLCSVLKEGETAIYSVINECIENGYAYRYQARDKNGRMLPGEFVVSDSKLEISTLKIEFESRPEFKKNIPNRENQGTESPHPENQGAVPPGDFLVPIYSNTDNSNTREQQQQQNAAVSSKFEHLKKQQAEYNKSKQSYEKPVQPEKPKIYGNLAKIDIPEADKIEITARYSELIVQNAIAWATHPTTKLTKGLAPAIKWACVHQPTIAEPKKPEKTPIDPASFNKTYYREISTVASQNGYRLHSYGIREGTNDYLETENSKIYYKDLSFLEQVANFIRKKSIECRNIFDMIKACQQDLVKQNS